MRLPTAIHVIHADNGNVQRGISIREGGWGPEWEIDKVVGSRLRKSTDDVEESDPAYQSPKQGVKKTHWYDCGLLKNVWDLIGLGPCDRISINIKFGD